MIASTQAAAPVPPISTPDPSGLVPASGLRVIKRTGTVSDWDPGKISTAIARAFLAVEGPQAAGSDRIHDLVEVLTTSVTEALTRRADATRALHIEDIQDQVELALMRAEHHKVARAYVLYGVARGQLGAGEAGSEGLAVMPKLIV